jgi:hypothetical protein
VPPAEAALVLLRHGAQERRDEPRHPGGRGEDDGAGDRVALVGHRRRAAAVVGGRLRRLADLGLHEERDVPRDLPETADEKPERGPDLGEPVAARVPG